MQQRRNGQGKKAPAEPTTTTTAASDATATTAKAKAAAEEAEAKKKKKGGEWGRRTWTGLLMAAAFCVLVGIGHWACVALIVALQAAMFHELRSVRTPTAEAEEATETKEKKKKKKEPLPEASGWVDWGLFGVATWYVVGRIVSGTFMEQLVASEGGAGRAFVRYHALGAFCGYCCVFVLFVCTLRRGATLKGQFQQFAWTHMVLLSEVLQANLWIHNVFKGLFWLLLPASLVIVNDVFAFVAGSLLGRTPLIALSPKKTWEGWVGGTVATFVWGFFAAGALAQVPWLTCPKLDLYRWDVAPCAVPAVFQATEYSLFGSGGMKVTLMPVQLHALVLAAFASVVAPFGGFFASGLKRAFNKKDFNNVIPGHGGVTDRFDCQLLTGTFSNLYITTFIYKCAHLIDFNQLWLLTHFCTSCVSQTRNPVATVIGKVAAMDTSAQMEVFERLRSILSAKGAFI